MQNKLLHQLQGFGVHLGCLPAGLHQVTDVDVQVIQQLFGCTQHIPWQQRLADVTHLLLPGDQKELDTISKIE